MTADPAPTARRYAPRELGGLDLTLEDARVVWALSATASSEWSSSYSASAACGPPRVFPGHGDEHGTWLAESSDTQPHIELTLPATTGARALVVCETCGAGSVRAIIDLDRDAVLLDAKAKVPADRRTAQLLVVPLPDGAPSPRRVRLELRGRKADYEEIDAVGLLLAPLAELTQPRPALSGSRHQRYAPDALAVHDLRGDPRLNWAKSARASSEYSSSYAPRHATGRPRVFPRGGDHDRTWLSDNSDRNAWLALTFKDEGLCYGFVALETCGAGAIVRATDPSGLVLWQGAVETVPRREARLLCVQFDEPRRLTSVRLYVSPRVSDYREVDAVALLLCPFDDLARPAPPPPPAPVAGEPDGGFARVTGTLVGPSPAAPLLHLTLTGDEGTRHLNHGGPAQLRLPDGRALVLELERTTIYGAPVLRRALPFGDLCLELPWLRGALGDRAPADVAQVAVEGTQLVGGEHLFVAGTPTARGARGFREAAGQLRGLVAAVLSTEPLEQTDFHERGVDAFERKVARDTPASLSGAATPLFVRWRRIANRVVAATGVVLAGALWGAAGPGPLLGPRAALLAGALVTLLAALVFALELHGRARLVTVVEEGGRASAGRVRATSPGWTALGTGFIMGVAALLGAVAAGSAEPDAREPILRLGLALSGAHALLRVVLWRWADRGSLRAALPLLLARPTSLVDGKRGIVFGALGTGHRTTEALRAHSEHLGSYQSTDEEGRVTTHERYRHWNTSRLTCDAGNRTVLFLADGTELRVDRARRVVDAGMVHGVAAEQTYARFRSTHREGDPAALLGRLRLRNERWIVEDAVILLGSRRRLAGETGAQLVALASLLLLVGLGVLAVAL